VPKPGYVAGRMTYFAPVSLVFFFSVLVMVAIRNRINLHPMNYFFLACGCFAFQLLFAYLVDLLPLMGSFLIAASISLALVNGYLWRAAGPGFARVSTLAQLAYMVLFSYSFFFDGLTGIAIAIGAVVTLGLLMALTAKVDWSAALRSQATPPPLPTNP
jgi:inner membrane protein involved in colicin E2 resistance